MDYFHSRRYLDTLPDWEVGPVDLGPLDNYQPRMRALLGALDDPQRHYPSIIVGGTNGKGTVISLLANLLTAAGRTVGLYTSPHLHTLRERIRVAGQMQDKDAWAQATSLLYDRTRDFEAHGLGGFSKYEAMTALAAHMFAGGEVDFGLFEVGLGGRYDATNAWDSDLAVLTSISLDHQSVLGDSLLEIAGEKLEIARPGKPLFTTATQDPEVLEYITDQAAARGVDLYLVGADRVERSSCATAAETWPVAVALPDTACRRPRSHADNARLALAAGRQLLGERLTTAMAQTALEQHQWFGRFEIVEESPPLILDGAHNPSAAADLVERLGTLAPKWHFVVGVNAGHDAKGILHSLAPLAAKITLTSSAHPKAIEVEGLRPLVPPAVPLRLEPVCRKALHRAREEQAASSSRLREGLCVLGSLHLVARAREFFDLPFEREGISEDVALESLECVEIACRRRGIASERVTTNGNVLRLNCGGGPRYFMRNKHPFNDYVAARLAEDKGYQYELFSQAGLPVPRTMQVFNPLADARFDRYKTHRTVEEIVAEVGRDFDFPLVIKKYRSSVSQGVYLERNDQALNRRLSDLFEHSSFSDNVVLIQSYVDGEEFRAVGSRDRLLLAYEKQSDEVLAKGDLNPLHHSSGRAQKVTDLPLLEEMETVLRSVAGVVELGFYAIDLIRGRRGFQILEINPNPFCYFYNRDNGRDDFVRIYEQLLTDFP